MPNVVVTCLCSSLIGVLLFDSAALAAQTVVQSYPRNARAPALWIVEPRPRVEFGGSASVGATEFTGIVGVVRLSTGAIVVADGASRELRLFDPRGRFVRTLARQGRGPGELPELGGLISVADTIIVMDGRQAVHLFAPDGAWIRSFRIPSVAGFIVNPAIGALTASDIVINLRSGSMERMADVRNDSIWSGRVSLRDSSTRLIATQPLPPAYALSPGGPPTYPHIFSPRPLHAIAAGRMCLGYPARYVIRCVDSTGRSLLEIRRDVAIRSVTDSARRAYQSRYRRNIARFEPSLRAHRERVLEAAQYASIYPAYSQLMLARTGELWVRDFATEDGFTWHPRRTNNASSRWSIYDRSGRWIADCVLPARFAPTDIGADYVLGISRDDDDVERVTLLSYRR